MSKFEVLQVAAGFVQGIGSIAAIGAGFLLFFVQRQRDRHDVLEAAGRLVVAGLDVLDVHVMNRSGKSSAPDPVNKFYGFENLRLAMESLPAERLPPEVLPLFATFGNFMRQAERRISEMDRVANSPLDLPPTNPPGLARLLPDRVGPLEAELRDLHRTAHDVFEELKKVMQEHGVDLARLRRRSL